MRRFRIGRRRCRSIESRFQPGCETKRGCTIRLFGARWRHHAAFQLLNRFFPNLTVLRHARQVHRVEGYARDLVVDVMAGDAVLIDEGFA